jgi:hypothetical protein
VNSRCGGVRGGLGSPLAGFPPNKEIRFFDDFYIFMWLLARFLADIFSSWNCGFFWRNLSLQVMAILCCVAKNSLCYEAQQGKWKVPAVLRRYQTVSALALAHQEYRKADLTSAMRYWSTPIYTLSRTTA